MKYFTLTNSSGDDVGKNFKLGIQIKSRVVEEYDYNDEKSYQFLPSLDAPKIIPDLGSFIVEPKASMTDFVSCMGIIPAIGFIVSEKVKLLFEHFNSMRHFFYPTQLLHKNRTYHYYWLHLAEDFKNYIDFQKSSFVTRRPAMWDIPDWDEQIKPMPIESINTLDTIAKDIAGIRVITPVNLFVNHLPLDIFAFSCFAWEGVIVSEKFKTVMIKANVTGVVFSEVRYPIFFQDTFF